MFVDCCNSCRTPSLLFCPINVCQKAKSEIIMFFDNCHLCRTSSKLFCKIKVCQEFESMVLFLIASRPTGHLLYHFANKNCQGFESIIFFDCVSSCRTAYTRPINICQEFDGIMSFHFGCSHRISSFCTKTCLSRVWKYNSFIASRPTWHFVYYFAQ